MGSFALASTLPGPRLLLVGEDAVIAQLLRVQLDRHFAGERCGNADITHFSRIPDAARHAFRKEYHAIVLAPTMDNTDLDSQNSKGEALLRDIRTGKYGEPTTSTPVVLVCGVSDVAREGFARDARTFVVDMVHTPAPGPFAAEPSNHPTRHS